MEEYEWTEVVHDASYIFILIQPMPMPRTIFRIPQRFLLEWVSKVGIIFGTNDQSLQTRMQCKLET